MHGKIDVVVFIAARSLSGRDGCCGSVGLKRETLRGGEFSCNFDGVGNLRSVFFVIMLFSGRAWVDGWVGGVGGEGEGGRDEGDLMREGETDRREDDKEGKKLRNIVRQV